MSTATHRLMPAYRVCLRFFYANEPDGVVKPAYWGGDAWYGQFGSDQYWVDRDVAEQWLADAKAKWAEEAANGSEFIAKTDPALAERVWKHDCSQEDCRLPYYEAVRDAAHAVEHAKWGEALFIDRWDETSDICRLNTLLSDWSPAGERKRNELKEKMHFFGECTISWSCMGHTRASWQTQSDAEWIKTMHPECEVELSDDRVFVRDRGVREQ